MELHSSHEINESLVIIAAADYQNSPLIPPYLQPGSYSFLMELILHQEELALQQKLIKDRLYFSVDLRDGEILEISHLFTTIIRMTTKYKTNYLVKEDLDKVHESKTKWQILRLTNRGREDKRASMCHDPLKTKTRGDPVGQRAKQYISRGLVEMKRPHIDTSTCQFSPATPHIWPR
ncbi:unnamed protein product [Dovyalis caffra]|uniref:Uncharacterized protein n=1 Tax=Dovyalis caffra TaxID=77055 RepID=A0AAV1SV52_9ROSI|nr:unnamed protein product [Dovyalis caffra]